MAEIRSENPRPEKRPMNIQEPLNGEHWSGRKRTGRQRPGLASSFSAQEEEPLEFVDWYPQGTEREQPPSPPPVRQPKPRKGPSPTLLLLLLIMLLVGAFFAIRPLKRWSGKEVPPPPPKAEAPTEAPSKPPPPPLASKEDLYYQTWYLLTKSAEGEGLRVKSTFETPEKVKREQEAMGPPVQGSLPFDHERFFYFSITLQATEGVLSPEFVIQAPSRFALVDDRGHRVRAKMLPAFEERAAVLETERGGIAEANFYLAFPKEMFLTSSTSLALEAPGRKAGEKLILTWQLPIHYPE